MQDLIPGEPPRTFQKWTECIDQPIQNTESRERCIQQQIKTARFYCDGEEFDGNMVAWTDRSLIKSAYNPNSTTYRIIQKFDLEENVRFDIVCANGSKFAIVGMCDTVAYHVWQKAKWTMKGSRIRLHCTLASLIWDIMHLYYNDGYVN